MEELDGSGRGTSHGKDLEERATINPELMNKKLAEKQFLQGQDDEDFLDELLGSKHETAGTREHSPLSAYAQDLTRFEPKGKSSGFGKHLSTRGKHTMQQNEEDEESTGFASAVESGEVQDQIGVQPHTAYYGEEEEESGGLSQDEKKMFGDQKNYDYPQRGDVPLSRPPKLHDQIRDPLMTQNIKKENDALEAELLRKKRLQAELNDMERKIRGE